jgi:hypothetical protein
MYLTQMVNTRRGGGIDLPPNRHTRRIYRQPQPQPAEMNPPNPPPGGVDPLVAAQMAVMQQMADTMADMRAQMQQERQEMRQEREDIRQELRQERDEIRQERRAQQQQLQQQLQQQQQQQQVPLPPPPPPVPPRDKHREFMSHKPPTFASSPDPLDADDWLKSIEKMLNIAQCTDREKVLYASGRLTGPAADWWDSYTAAHDAADAITWAEFSTQFRNYHIPAGMIKIKKKEFLSLKQGNMSVSEYRDKFIQLSRYAPEEVAEAEGDTTRLRKLSAPAIWWGRPCGDGNCSPWFSFRHHAVAGVFATVIPGMKSSSGFALISFTRCTRQFWAWGTGTTNRGRAGVPPPHAVGGAAVALGGIGRRSTTECGRLINGSTVPIISRVG